MTHNVNNTASDHPPPCAESSADTQCSEAPCTRQVARKSVSFNSEIVHWTPSASLSISPMLHSSRVRKSSLSPKTLMVTHTELFERQTSPVAILQRQQKLERKIDRELKQPTYSRKAKEDAARIIEKGLSGLVDFAVVAPFLGIMNVFKQREPAAAEPSPQGTATLSPKTPEITATPAGTADALSSPSPLETEVSVAGVDPEQFFMLLSGEAGERVLIV